MPITDREIIAAIFESKTITFRKLQCATKSSPNTLRKRLDDLERRKMVHEEGDAKRGKAHLLSLTNLGQDTHWRLTIENVQDGLDVLHRAMEAMASNPEFGPYREAMRQLYPKIHVGSGKYPGDYPVAADDEYRKEEIKKTFKRFKRLLNSFNRFWVELGTQTT